MSPRPSPRHAELAARPLAPAPGQVLTQPGIHPLGLGNEIRDGRLYIPRPNPDALAVQPPPLLVLLHGAGGDASSMLRLIGPDPTAKTCVLLAPDARKHTWDFLVDDFGPDVDFLDHALRSTFAQYPIDPQRIALAGFSDGASYALTLGLANGDLFTHVMAFSPGFMRPPRLKGHPRLFLSHGTADTILPIARCTHRLLPELERLRYDLTYREFDGAHTLPEPILADALHWFLS